MHLVSSICLLFLHQIYSSVSSMTDNRNLGNYNDTQPYVVGILSPSTTLYIDQGPPPDNNENSPVPPMDLNLERRNTNSFQITSVTVQGSRKHDDLAEDSCDDLDESHTDDLSSDMLDSSRADNEGYHSEDNLCDDLSSPCGPIIWQLPTGSMVDRNMNLSIGVTPTFAAIGPVAGGVTMMTSKSESPISAQVPIMNPLPNNWQRRFKVVKIMSSEPFRRGRWLCMDFKDPPADVENESPKPEMNGTPPAIQITNFDDSEEHREHLLAMENFAQVYEIPINQTFSGNYIMSSQQHMYGIILPQNEYVQPVTLVQDLSLQTTDRNFNNLVNHQSILVQADPYGTPPNHPMLYSPPVGLVNSNSILNQSPPATQIVDSNYVNPSEAVLNQINASGNNGICDNTVVPPTLPRSRNNSNSHRIPPHVLGMDITIGVDAEETESSQSAPEKLPSSEVGQEVDPSAGSAAPTGANTVAIDNKIEQAMDLVKSHLMFAVREEVEVLKEKITELLERISQLEHENDILRANASAETLKQLNNQSHKKTASGGTTGKPSPVGPIPPPST